jgi:hypothetical protein
MPTYDGHFFIAMDKGPQSDPAPVFLTEAVLQRKNKNWLTWRPRPRGPGRRSCCPPAPPEIFPPEIRIGSPRLGSPGVNFTDQYWPEFKDKIWARVVQDVSHVTIHRSRKKTMMELVYIIVILFFSHKRHRIYCSSEKNTDILVLCKYVKSVKIRLLMVF